MNKYQINFYFEWGGDYLWPDTEDPFTYDRFDCDPIEPGKLDIPQPLIEMLDSLCDEYQTSLDWEYPPNPSPWTFNRFLEFEKKTAEALSRLRDCLKDTCYISDRTPKMDTLAEVIEDAFVVDPECDEGLLEKLLEENPHGWDSILRALQYILLKSNDVKLCEFVENIVWDAVCDGKSLGIDKDSVIALLYGRRGNLNAPYDDNTLWSIVSTVNGLDYANSEYNPLIDENIVKYLQIYGFIPGQS